MAITSTLGVNPKWYIADLVGRPLGGGYMATLSSLDHVTLNPVYQNAARTITYPYVNIPNHGNLLGVLFDENGSQGPFYFKFDSDFPDVLYYLEIYDSDGVIQWTIDDYDGGGSGGGGSIITEAVDLTNLVVNNVFWRNIGATASPIGNNFTKLAPGSNTGLVQTASNCGPDICFVRTGSTTATDQITFPNFDFGVNTLPTDITPAQYLHYECNNAPVGELLKVIRIPITSGVNTLANTSVKVSVWVRGNSGTTTFTLSWLQFFGDGASASTAVRTGIGSDTGTSTWTRFTFLTTIPSVIGKTVGECHNDGLFLEFQYPLGVLCSIDFVKPTIYLDEIIPLEQYETYDMINAVIDSPRTGAVRIGIDSFNQYGWVPMDDGTIGNVSSNATTRANNDTFPLFSFLWSISASFTPMFTSAGTPVARGATAVADYQLNYKISLTRALGRSLGGAGTGSGLTTRALGEFVGTEIITLTRAEIPTPITVSAQSANLGVASPGAQPVLIPSTAPGGASIFNIGGGNPFSKMQPITFMNVFMKL